VAALVENPATFVDVMQTKKFLRAAVKLFIERPVCSLALERLTQNEAAVQSAPENP